MSKSRYSFGILILIHWDLIFIQIRVQKWKIGILRHVAHFWIFDNTHFKWIFSKIDIFSSFFKWSFWNFNQNKNPQSSPGQPSPTAPHMSIPTASLTAPTITNYMNRLECMNTLDWMNRLEYMNRLKYVNRLK